MDVPAEHKSRPLNLVEEQACVGTWLWRGCRRVPYYFWGAAGQAWMYESLSQRPARQRRRQKAGDEAPCNVTSGEAHSGLADEAEPGSAQAAQSDAPDQVAA